MPSRRHIVLAALALALSLGATGARADRTIAADPTGTLRVDVSIVPRDGLLPEPYSADFEIQADCGAAGTFMATAFATTNAPPAPTPAMFTDLPAGAVCTVSEGPLPTPPDGYGWIDPVLPNGSSATIPADGVGYLGIDRGVVRAGLWVHKGVSRNPDTYLWSESEGFQPGQTVYYRIEVQNTSDVPLTGVTLTDDHFDLDTEGCAIPTALAVGQSFTCDYSTVAVVGTHTNVATGQSDQFDRSASATYEAVVYDPILTIDKTTNAPKAHIPVPNGPDVVVSTADEGDTVTFTLAYTLKNDIVNMLVIHDVLPAGVTYVPGSATANDEIFPDPTGEYDAGTRTLTWTTRWMTGGLGVVSHSGSVAYKVTVDEGAEALSQPLWNVATIVSDNTPEDKAEAALYVGPLPEGAGTAGEPTAPATDAAEAAERGGSVPAPWAWLVVLGVGVAVGGSVVVRRVPGARGVPRR